MYRVFQMTRRYDPSSGWWMAGAFLIPFTLGVVLGLIFTGGSLFSLALWILPRLLAAILAFLSVLGRQAAKAGYSQIEGQRGAVGAVLKSSLRRGGTASELPVAVSPKTQDAVFFFQAEDGIRDLYVTGVQTCALPIWRASAASGASRLGPATRASSGRCNRAARRSRTPSSRRRGCACLAPRRVDTRRAS